jgi:2-isopropylmalate synthase
MTAAVDRVIIFDTTLRDGEQSPGFSLTSEQKLKMAQQLARLGVDVIEAGFPAASPDDFAAVQRIAREVRGPIIAGLARCVPDDIDRCWEAVKPAQHPRIHTFLSSSDIHLEGQFKLTREEALQRCREMVSRARSYCEDVEFSPMDATRSDRDYLYEMIAVAIEAGATTINVADTCGYAVPEQFGQLIKGIFDTVPGADKIVVSVHCHDDLGMAVANALSAVKNGARQIEGCINGIGERAGNAAIEEIVMALNVRRDYFGLETEINLSEIHPTSQLLQEFTGIGVQPNKAVVGANAFAHESGIHQDGMLKDRRTYEIMEANTLGYTNGSRLVLGKHSGRHALKVRLAQLGFELSVDELREAFATFKNVADFKKEVTDDDLREMMGRRQAISAVS